MTDYQTIAECYILAHDVKKQWMKQALKEARNIISSIQEKPIERKRELDTEHS